MTPERLAELKVRLAVGDSETWDAKELFDYIDEDTKELFVYIDQLRVDAERWRTVLQVVSDTQPNSNTPHNWEQWELPLFKVPGPFASEADEFTAAVDLMRTQKAPG